jgi:hypothetical protein
VEFLLARSSSPLFCRPQTPSGKRLFEKTGKIVQDAGISPQPVADKLVLEIVRCAAVEDDEHLHTMFAALLANAASPESAGKVRPGYIAILKQMAPDEAALLSWMAAHKGKREWPMRKIGGFLEAHLLDVWGDLCGFGPMFYDRIDMGNPLCRRQCDSFRACVDSLGSRSLITSETCDERRYFNITDPGEHFLEACSSPKPKA